MEEYPNNDNNSTPPKKKTTPTTFSSPNNAVSRGTREAAASETGGSSSSSHRGSGSGVGGKFLPSRPASHPPLPSPSSSVTTSCSVDTASYAEFMKRSMMQDKEQEELVQDDDDHDDQRRQQQQENGGMNGETTEGGGGGGASSQQQQLRGNLASLQVQTLPPIPDEQDRKRFLGCLAATLAHSYNYDSVEHDEDWDDVQMAESYAYLNKTEQGEDDDDDKKRNNKAGADDGAELKRSTSTVDHEGISLYKTLSWSETASQGGGDASSSASAPSSSSQQQQQPRKPERLSEKDKDRIRKATRRHRKRRYDVLSQLLLSSADLLMLDKFQAKAFLPMLSQLLVPKAKSASSSKNGTSDGNTAGSEVSGAAGATSSSIGSPVKSPSARLRVGLRRKPQVESQEDVMKRHLEEIEYLEPFMESLTPGAGLRCLAMLLTQHLLSSEAGYDARIRRAIKYLGVLVLVHDMEHDPVEAFAEETTVAETTTTGEDPQQQQQQKRSRLDMVALATRKFESLEHCIALKLIQLAEEQKRQGRGAKKPQEAAEGEKAKGGFNRKSFMRGLKVGGTAVAAGTLFAVTGGLAAPAIATAVAATMAGSAAAAAAAAILTSTAAVTTIFGVGGGTLAAYKMNRRVKGLTEFEFQKETGNRQSHDKKTGEATPEAELFSTICISGWLRDKYDYQRPWGVHPTNPPLTNRVELLERFYAVYKPDHIPKSAKIVANWKGEEDNLWLCLRQKYGKDPDQLYPFEDGPRYRAALTLEQEEAVDDLFKELGRILGQPEEKKSSTTPMERMRNRFNRTKATSTPSGEDGATPTATTGQSTDGLLHGFPQERTPSGGGDVMGFDSVSTASLSNTADSNQKPGKGEETELPKHIATVWDYQATYGGELYTIRWENRLLKELCDSVAELAVDVVTGGTAQILKHTALSTVFAAFAWPYALVSAASAIDGVWTLAVERSDEAGRELARSLLFSGAGNRPVTLVGFSFGARAIYSCLKELARYQEQWEDYQEEKNAAAEKAQNDKKKAANTTENDESFANMREPASIVEDAIIMGLPNHLSLLSWHACRQVVAGRLVNCFSQKDLILSLMFQYKRLSIKPVCGTCPINVPGVENVDVSDLIEGHQDYCLRAGDVLKKVRHAQPFRSTNSVLLGTDATVLEIPEEALPSMNS